MSHYRQASQQFHYLCNHQSCHDKYRTWLLLSYHLWEPWSWIMTVDVLWCIQWHAVLFNLESGHQNRQYDSLRIAASRLSQDCDKKGCFWRFIWRNDNAKSKLFLERWEVLGYVVFLLKILVFLFCDLLNLLKRQLVALKYIKWYWRA